MKNKNLKNIGYWGLQVEAKQLLIDNMENIIKNDLNSFIVFKNECTKTRTTTSTNGSFTLQQIYSFYVDWCLIHSIDDIKTEDEVIKILHEIGKDKIHSYDKNGPFYLSDITMIKEVALEIEKNFYNLTPNKKSRIDLLYNMKFKYKLDFDEICLKRTEILNFINQNKKNMSIKDVYTHFYTDSKLTLEEFEVLYIQSLIDEGKIKLLNPFNYFELDKWIIGV